MSLGYLFIINNPNAYASKTQYICRMDVFGMALKDFFNNTAPEILWINNTYSEPEEMPVEIYFRDEAGMSDLEILALNKCKGKILDIGAGVGSHALALQKHGMNITALEISPIAINIMQERGVIKTVCADIFKYQSEKYDTLLLLMNGIGLAGDLPGLNKLLIHLKKIIKPGGQLLFDSSDIAYLYEDIPYPKTYYGELNYQYAYKQNKSNWFKWLYIDQQQLHAMALITGWKMEILFEDDADQYLAKLILNT
jgi:SAM-dependent methyltransferase